VLFIDVFHDSHLELAGQKQNGHHGHEYLKPPVGIGTGFLGDSEKVFRIGKSGRFLHQIVEAVKNTEGHENSNGDKGRQFHDGFECNGCHQTFMPFSGVQMTCTKKN